jgi:ribonuclease T1
MRLLLGLLLSCACWIVQAQDISRDKLPPEGRETMALIEAGGPFPHKRDGIVFNNFEKLLPLEKRGHYREYTVRTPGVKHRGARRIVCGGGQTTRPAACWYTADHYRSFRKIVQDTTP